MKSSSSQPSPWLSGFATLSAVVTLFFLATNGIPLIQLGLLSAFEKKKYYANTAILSLALFALFLSFLRWRYTTAFENLWIIKFVKRLLRLPLKQLLCMLFVIYVLTLSAVGLMRHGALETRAFDLGIFAQALWNTTRGDFLYSSIKGGICLLGDHLSPILALLAPLYTLLPSPNTLIVLQVIAAASNIFLIASIAKEKTGRNDMALVFALAYAFFHPTRSALHEDFHPEVLVEPFIFLSFICLEKGKIGWFLVNLFLVALGKENMLGVVFMLGVYAFIWKNQKALGAFLMAVSPLILAANILWLSPHLSRTAYLYQANYLNLFSQPLSIVRSLFHPESLEYALKIFSPFLFLPFFHGPTFLLCLPILLQNLLSSNPVMRSFNYHYTTGLTPFLYISAIYGLETASKRWSILGIHKGKIALLLLLSTLFQSGPSEYYYFWQSLSHKTDHRDVVRQELRKIPSRFSLLTHNNFIPQSVNRKEVFQFSHSLSETKTKQALQLQVDYVIFDREFWEPATPALEQSFQELIAAGYQTIFQDGDFYILKRLENRNRLEETRATAGSI